MTSTSLTFVEDEGSRYFWQIKVPQTGFEFPFVFHLTLALSGLHMARDRLEIRESSISRAEHHLDIGLRGVSAILPDLTAENCEAIWIASILLCFISFARGP